MEELNEDKVLEVRMYCFVPYNISGRQMGIQSLHAALRYARAFSADDPDVWDFVDNHETVIVLDGGTTNSDRDFDGIAAGTLNQIADQILEADIPFSYFIEPDLNNALSAVCFLASEQVFNFKDYPDFIDYLADRRTTENGVEIPQFKIECELKGFMAVKEEYPDAYKEWVRFMGGVKNVFLREITKGKKKA